MKALTPSGLAPISLLSPIVLVGSGWPAFGIFAVVLLLGGGGNRCRIYKSNGPHIEIAILHVRPFFCVCREGQPIVRHGGICIPFLLVGKKKNGVEEGGKKFFLLLPYRPFWQFCLNRPQSMQSKQTVLCPGIFQFSLFLNNYVR